MVVRGELLVAVKGVECIDGPEKAPVLMLVLALALALEVEVEVETGLPEEMCASGL